MIIRIGTVGALLLGSVAAVVGMSSPASADCVTNLEYTMKTPANSDKFNASTNCDGAYVQLATSNNDLVRAQYLDGDWIQSSYGWKDVYTTFTGEKIVGNTIDGRRMRGETHDYNQFIKYKY